MLKPKNILLAMAAMVAAAIPASAVELTSANPTITEDFNSMWIDGEPSLTLPDGWKVDRNLIAPRKVGSWDEASSEVMYSGGISLASNAKNGTWNFGSSSNPSDRAVGGLTTTVSSGTRGVNVMTSIRNTDQNKIITNIGIDYDIEKYRLGANAAGFSVILYYSADGEKWTSAGDDFVTRFDPDSETAGATVVPISTTSVNGKNLRVHVEPGDELYLAWNISVTSGATPDKAPGLAVDNIRLNASFADEDPDWVEPDEPLKNPSGIYLRGEINSWAADEDWEFDRTGDGTYQLVNKELSGLFKIGDDSWSSACNFGSNGSMILMDSPYVTIAGGTSGNISCGSNTYNCDKILLSIVDGVATLTLVSDSRTDGLTSVYLVGDFNNWNYMDTSGCLQLNESTGLFEGRVSLPASSDGLSHWRLYQRLGMSGAWGLASDATVASISGKLTQSMTGNVATASGTYDITFNLSTGEYTLLKTSTVATEMILEPSETVLVPVVPESVKVLSLNNSLIHYNDQSAVFNSIASAMGNDAVWTKHTLLGKSLATHWNEGDGLAEDGMPGAKMMVRSQPWSHIILQEQSSLPRTNPGTFRENVAKWVEYIRTNCPNPNAVIILPVNWAYYGDWDNFTAYNKEFIANYIDVANEFGLTICPVISAYQSVYDKEGVDGISPWFQDDRHPTDMSTYMAACMEYGLIYGIDPRTIDYTPSAVSATDGAKMRAYASEALKGWVNTVDHTAGKVRFNVSVKDEFGMDVDPGTLTFTVDNGGEINAEHEFVTTIPGLYHVSVTNGQFTCEAVVTVAEAVTEMPYVPAIPLNADNLTYEQTFDSMGDAANATLPLGWRIDRQTNDPRVVGSFHSAVEATTYSGGVNLPSNAKNGIWNFGDNAGSDRAVGGITTGVADGTRAINIYAHFVNDGKKNLENICLSYNIEKYRDGNNAAGFTVKLYYSADGNSWTAAGEDLVTVFDPSSATAGFATVPGETVKVAGVIPGNIGAGCDLYLAWNISVTSGDNCAGAPALAIDDVVIETSLPEIPVFNHYIYIDDQTGYQSIGVYAYGDNEIWGAWPGQAPIDEKEIYGTVYKVFGHNVSSGNHSLIVNNWNQGSQLPDFPINGGRDYYLLATDSGVTEKTPSVSSSVDQVAPGNSLNVSSDGTQIIADGCVITVYTTSGVVVAHSDSGILSLSAMPVGIYIVETVSATRRDTTRIVRR